MMISPAYINNLASIHPNGLDTEQHYLKACEPDYKIQIQNPTLRRRMSRIVKMGVACGLECIGDTPKEDIQAIITATGLGCLADTEKFMNNLLDNQEQLLNPTPFIQSTFNTVGAQLALICQNQAYNVTYVHRGFSFESALLDGLLRLSEGDRNVLVGAFDEITPTSLTIQERMSLLKDAYAGEGSQFFLLGKEKNENTLARIAVPQTFITFQEGDKKGSLENNISNQIENYLKSNGLSIQDIDLFVSGRNGNSTKDSIYSTIKNELFPQATEESFKEHCGEYQTATAFAAWQTAQRLNDNKEIKYALIYNHYNAIDHSLILISQP